MQLNNMKYLEDYYAITFKESMDYIKRSPKQYLFFKEKHPLGALDEDIVRISLILEFGNQLRYEETCENALITIEESLEQLKIA